MPTLKIDEKEVTVPPGTTLIRAAKELGIEIPYYCWHPGLSVAGNCRMCLVEVDKMPKPQISCHIQCQDGMVVRTQSETVKKLREHVLEFLLVNHPLDCPVCDQAGECGLQDYYMKHGLYDSRLNENKVKKGQKAVPIGPTVMLDNERCILCSRCVRFTDEISKSHEFGIFNRGDHSEIGLYPGEELNNKYSGNVVDICPVGALTDRDFRFKCRVWYLKKTESICPGCARGCNITIETSHDRPTGVENERVMRLKPRFNDEVNDWWICDSGRYGYHSIDQNRILTPLVREGTAAAKESNWKDALKQACVSFQNLMAQNKEQIAILLSPMMTNEEIYLAHKLFVETLQLSRVLLLGVHPNGDQDDLLIRSDKHPNRMGAEWLGLIEGKEVTQKLVSEIEKGLIQGLFLFGQDIVSQFQSERLNGALNQMRLSLFIGSNYNQTVSSARMILPGASYAEKDGTFTNFEGRVQRIRKALFPLGESRSELEIIQSFAAQLGLDLPSQTSEDIFLELAGSVPKFRGMTYDTIGHEGVRPA